MAKKTNTQDSATPIDAKTITSEIFEAVISNFGHVSNSRILEIYELLKNSKK